MYGIVTYIWMIYRRHVGKYFIHGAFGIDHDYRGTGKFVNSRFVLNSAHELAICGKHHLCASNAPLKSV